MTDHETRSRKDYERFLNHEATLLQKSIKDAVERLKRAGIPSVSRVSCSGESCNMWTLLSDKTPKGHVDKYLIDGNGGLYHLFMIHPDDKPYEVSFDGLKLKALEEFNPHPSEKSSTASLMRKLLITASELCSDKEIEVSETRPKKTRRWWQITKATR